MLIKKSKYLKNIMKLIKKKLEVNLPDEDFETNMFAETREILDQHLFGRK